MEGRMAKCKLLVVTLDTNLYALNSMQADARESGLRSVPDPQVARLPARQLRWAGFFFQLNE